MTTQIADPTPALVVTTRCEADAIDRTVADAVAALRETAKQLALVVAGDPVRVRHGDATVVEVALPIAALPDDDPPPPVAAEVLVPGTVVAAVGSD